MCFCLIFALPFKKGYDFVAQLVEQYTFNVWVLGSSPSEITITVSKHNGSPQMLNLRGFLFQNNTVKHAFCQDLVHPLFTKLKYVHQNFDK